MGHIKQSKATANFQSQLRHFALWFRMVLVPGDDLELMYQVRPGWEAQAFCPPSPTVTVNQMFIILFCRRAGPGHSFTRMLRVLAVWVKPPSSVIWHSRLVVVWSHTRKEGCMRSLSAAPVRKKSWRQAKMLERSLMSHAVALQEWLHMPARLQLPWFLRVLSWLAYTVWHQA